MTVETRAPARNWTAWILQGVIGGIVAGIMFSVFEMAWGFLQGGADMAVAPLRMIGGIALGPQALEPSYSLLTAAFAGVAVHMVLSMIYGGAFALGVGLLAPRAGTTAIVAAGIAVGLALWVVNFFVIGPAAGWPWFADMTDPTIQAIAHGAFFGIPLGLYVARFRPRDATA
jgi:hypothetical protein